MPSAIIDGQDVDAVIYAVQVAAERARRGDGPSLLEVKTYRDSGHSRSDPATYRLEGELDEWKKHDLIDLLARRLGLSADDLAELERSVAQKVDVAVSWVLEAPPPDEAEMFAHIYWGGHATGRLPSTLRPSVPKSTI